MPKSDRFGTVTWTTKEKLIWDNGFQAGFKKGSLFTAKEIQEELSLGYMKAPKKRKLNSWQKFVKANSKKPRFRSMNNTARLKKLGIAYRKTAAYKRSKK